MRLNDFLRGDFVVLHLRSRSVDGVIGEVARAADAAGIGDAAAVGAALLERERLHPTAMGSGLAVPHATLPELGETVVGVALARGEGVAFGPPELGPVHAFLVILSPPGHEREHVRLLARICRVFREEALLGSLLAASRPEDVLEILASSDARHP